jgi:hypothetical protein
MPKEWGVFQMQWLHTPKVMRIVPRVMVRMPKDISPPQQEKALTQRVTVDLQLELSHLETVLTQKVLYRALHQAKDHIQKDGSVSLQATIVTLKVQSTM